MAVSRDTATLKSTMHNVDSVLTKLPPQAPKMQRASISYFGQALRAYYQLARGDTTAATKEFDSCRIRSSIFRSINSSTRD